MRFLKKKQKLIFLLSLVIGLSTSCNKEIDQLEPDCLAIGQLHNWYTGKWTWLHTTMNTPDSTYELNPSNSYEYYFTISEDKIYRGYKNGNLIQEFLISDKSHMNITSSTQSLEIYEDCTDEHFMLRPGTLMNGQLANSGSNTKYPIDVNFTDSSGTTYSSYNIFLKVE